MYGLANGTAHGGVPLACIAMYKVCWGEGCSAIDSMARFDAAITDGVDILSISLSGASMNVFGDPMAIGAFHAWKKGMLTVAASSIDIQFQTTVRLGNVFKTNVEDAVSRATDGTCVPQKLNVSSLRSQLGPLAAILLCIDVAATSSKCANMSQKLLDQAM